MKTSIEPANLYNDGAYLVKNKNWHAEDSPYKARFVMDSIKRNRITFGTCADIGCGAGLVTELMAENYIHNIFVGYELSIDAQKFWKQRKQLSNLTFSSENILDESKSFDLIICLDVFEHIEDYFGFLRALRGKGNKFIFNIPLDMNVMKILSPGIRYAREEVGHLHYFSEYTAIKTLEDCGYKVKDYKLSVSYLSKLPRNIRQWFILPIRLLSVVLGKSVAAKVFGGISLVAYATA